MESNIQIFTSYQFKTNEYFFGGICMIKAIFFDLDGTLLNSNKIIDDSTINALKQCRENGIKLFITTGRPPLIQKMLSFTDEVIELFHGGTYCNGGCIRIGSHSEYIFIPENIVSYCINKSSKYERLNIALQLKNEIHAFRYPLYETSYIKWGIEKKDSLEINKAKRNEIVKILIHYENCHDSVTLIPDELVNDLKAYCEDKANMYLTDKGKVIQIVNQEISKKESIEKIRKELMLDKKEIAVFGDDFNDIEMLLEYENSIAMGNAEDKIKNVARMVTKDNDNDGIAFALKTLLKVI